MSKYRIVHNPTPGARLKADYGRDIAASIRSQQFALRDGQRVSMTAHGTKIEFDQVASKLTNLTTPSPFDCTWQQIGEGMDAGQWQIYLPYGCVTVEQDGNVQSCVAVNDDGKASREDAAWQWYKIPTPNDKDATAQEWSGYIAKEWTVYVHIKPWPRMKATTEAKDDKFGKTEKSVAVATIGEIRFKDDKWRFSKKLVDSRSIALERDTTSPFSIVYEMESTHKDAGVIAWVANQTLAVGRMEVEKEDMTDATDWEGVYVIIEHAKETATLVVTSEREGKEKKSNDDQTVFRIYSMDKNVITEDLRDDMPILDFYTNNPDTGND